MINTILYLHNSSGISGGERSLLGLWSLLDRVQYRPIVILPSEGPLAVEARQLNVPVYICEIPAWRPLLLAALWKARRGLIALIKNENVRVIHSYSPRNNMMAVWVARACGLKVIWHERNIPVGRERDISRFFQSWPDTVLCNSHAVAARFYSSPKVKVIFNGVDAAYFQLLSEDRQKCKQALGLSTRKVVGVVANFSPRKGLELFIKVAAEISRKDPAVSFLVVGGCYGLDSVGRDEKLRKLAEDAGLSGRIVWAGFQPDVRTYLAAMDVLCHPTGKEACSRAILEAMASAIPVVAFADGGNPEIIENRKSGILVLPGDSQTMAAEVSSLLMDTVRRERLGMVARSRVEIDFSLRSNTEQTMEVYKALCA